VIAAREAFFPSVVSAFAVSAAVVSAAVVSAAVASAAASVADVAERQASADIPVFFDVSDPVSVEVAEGDSLGRPTSFVAPNGGYHASSSSYAAAAGKESARNAMDVRTNRDLCNILSNAGLHHNKNAEHSYNRPNHGRNNASDTNGLPMVATTSHSRKRFLHRCRVRRIHHPYQAERPPPEVPDKRWAAVAESQFRCLRLLLRLP
jgi:hypothetical protein